ncbi:hypothetical protein SmJEL517_g02212 [Synchytrium microbalum]|uniref:Cytochrome b561 domain-containing protein n=1 Tax=Synchytrium microbalum TaxID=1806994 RepID=A0A507C7F9_9FUNG|nr:uncharacterized protein SmJEL517_g02212 [Synchytrium microbalum]TPX35268.1 hypothetical protein SmJEL517_g02212 [Synchytrium microbalum]
MDTSRAPGAVTTITRPDDTETTPLLGEPAVYEAPKPPMWRRTVSIIAELLLLFVVVLSWFFAWNHGMSVFTWHPSAMSSFVFLSVSAVLALQQATSNLSRRDAFSVHWRMQILALLSLIVGFCIILYNKIQHKADHFTSLHGQFGLTTFVLAILQGAFGLSRKSWVWAAVGMRYQRIVAMHRLAALDSDWVVMYWKPHEFILAAKACIVATGLVLLFHAQWWRVLKLALEKEPSA